MSKRRQNWMAQADTLFSKHIRARDGACRASGYRIVTCAGNLQCAHLISRSYKSIRTNELNAVALCAAHHFYFTNKPLEWHEWVDLIFPGRWDELRELALGYERVDWKAEVVRLKELVAA